MSDPQTVNTSTSETDPNEDIVNELHSPLQNPEPLTTSDTAEVLPVKSTTSRKGTCDPFSNSFAVVIGIDEYTNGIPSLKTAVNDARRLAQVLESDYQYDVELLTEEVSLARLKQLLSETLPEKVGVDDRVLLYFAGHGIALEGDDGPTGPRPRRST